MTADTRDIERLASITAQWVSEQEAEEESLGDDFPFAECEACGMSTSAVLCVGCMKRIAEAVAVACV